MRKGPGDACGGCHVDPARVAIEKDRATIEETFRRLVELVSGLDEEQKRATREGLREEEPKSMVIILTV